MISTKICLRAWLVISLLIVCLPVYAAEYEAITDWNNKVTLSTPMSGVITGIHAGRGQTVNKDAVLIELDDRYLTADVERHRSDVARYQALLEETRKELERTIELYDRQLLAMHDRDVAYINLAEAEASLNNARARLKKAEIDLEHSTLHAPFDAIILDLPVRAGETVINTQQAVPLAIVAERGKMQANFSAAHAELSNIAVGQSVIVKIDDDSFHGSIIDISFEPVPSTDRYRVSVLFDTGDKLLRAGRRVRVVVQ